MVGNLTKKNKNCQMPGGQLGGGGGGGGRGAMGTLGFDSYISEVCAYRSMCGGREEGSKVKASCLTNFEPFSMQYTARF